MTSHNDKCAINIESPGYPLVLCPKNKVDQIEEEVETQASNHDAKTKTHLIACNEIQC